MIYDSQQLYLANSNTGNLESLTKIVPVLIITRVSITYQLWNVRPSLSVCIASQHLSVDIVFKYLQMSSNFLSRVSMQCTQSAILLRQIRLSVRLSNADTVSKRMDISSHFIDILV